MDPRSTVRARHPATALLALLLLAATPGAQTPLPGQIVRDPDHPQWLMRHGGDHVFLCGPGDPEDFFFRGTELPDGTRDGDQDALIDKLVAEGGNTLYVEAVRSHGGDGPADHNPFVNHDPAQGVNTAVLAQWEGWLQRAEDEGLVVYFFFYDDSTRVWSTGNGVFGDEEDFLHTIVDAFEHHPNIIWNVAEESEEKHSTSKVQNIALAIRAADDHGHLVGNHHHSSTIFKAWIDGGALDFYSMHLDVPPQDAHQGSVDARDLAEAAGAGGDGYIVSYTEPFFTSGAPDEVIRQFLWDSSMAGVMPLMFGPDIASTSPALLNECRLIAAWFEGTDFWTMDSADHLAAGGTTYVLADAPFGYIAYAAADAGDLGLASTTAGFYDLHWLDVTSGAEVVQAGVSLPGGGATLARPGGVGGECAVWVTRRWKDLGAALPGVAGPPRLDVQSRMVAGEDFTLTLTDARPSTFVYNVVGFSLLGAPFEGGTMVPALDVIVPGGTDLTGTQVIQTPFPAGFPPGASAYIQCWLQDPAAVFGWAGSNAVQGVGP